MRLAFVLAPLLAACAAPTYYQSGVPRTEQEHTTALAKCEREAGGKQFPNVIHVCMRDAGWDDWK